MQHARIGVYQVKPGTADEIARRAQAEMLPIFRSQPGFVAYGGVTTGVDTVISLSIWQTQEQAEAAVRGAASWIKDNIAEMIVSVQNHVGDLAFFSSTGTLGS
jgi:Antibiotic biosynthesis monooxygenase